jgi:hypothetical protein
MKLCARALLVLLPLVVTIPVAPASAQEADAADALFQKGKEEMKNKNHKAACAFFRGSYKLDPAPGALHALAVCHVEAGEVASAVMRLDEYLSIFEKLPPAQRAKHEERAKSAREQRAALAPQVPEVTIVLPAHAPPGTRVFQDSVELSAASLGIGRPVDPGDHMVTTQVPGEPVKEHPFTIKKGEKVRLELPVTAPPSSGEVGSRSDPGLEKARSIGPVVGGDGGERGGGPNMSGYRIGAFVAGGVGVAALVGGIVAGVIVLGKKSIIDENCSGTKCAPGTIAAAREAAESAQVPGAISTAGFLIGGAALAAGTVLFFLEPSDKPQESRAQKRARSIGIGLVSAGPVEWTAGVKGAW